jgi:hypothetical protein
MKKPAISSLTVILLLFLSITPALAEVLDPVVDVGTHFLRPDTQTIIAITVSTSDQNPVMVRALDLSIQVGDGGADNSNQQHQGTDTMPRITAVDIIGPGTLFYQPGGTQNDFHLSEVIPPGGAYMIWQAETELPPSESARAASGTLAYVTIDTTGMSIGETRTVTLKNVAQYVHPELPQGYTTDFGGVPAKLIDGQIVIVPEPATLVLLSVGILAVLLVRRRK